VSAIRLAIAVLLLGVAAPAAADFHLMSIREVYVGPADDASAQYVELQMYAAGQNRVDGHSLTFYGPTGTLAGTVTFPADVANGASQAYILIATPEAEAKFGVNADLAMTALIDPAGGRVCFADVDCFSWGSYSGEATTPSPSGNPFNPGAGLTPDSAARRDISGGSSGTRLDAADDTNDSAADFDFAATPDPRNNAVPDGGGDDGGCETYNCGGGGGGGGGGYGGGGALSLVASLLLLALRRAHRLCIEISGR
jgi:uncharacterized membrane protein YgcG